MENININGHILIINYQPTKIGDLVVDKNSMTVYTADIMNADDMNWIVQ